MWCKPDVDCKNAADPHQMAILSFAWLYVVEDMHVSGMLTFVLCRSFIIEYFE